MYNWIFNTFIYWLIKYFGISEFLDDFFRALIGRRLLEVGDFCTRSFSFIYKNLHENYLFLENLSNSISNFQMLINAHLYLTKIYRFIGH